MKRVGIFGGTFNPIHKGHINIAVHAANQLKLDRVLVIPNNIPPHKKDSQLLDGRIRYHLCTLACQDYPILEVDDIEISQRGKSYTINTLQSISKREDCSKLVLIIGSDKFLKLDRWVGFQEIIGLAAICTTPRKYGEIQELIQMKNRLQVDYGARVTICNPNIMPISSKEIRKNIAQGLDVSNMLDPSVYEYIKMYKLYE